MAPHSLPSPSLPFPTNSSLLPAWPGPRDHLAIAVPGEEHRSIHRNPLSLLSSSAIFSFA
ncbi:hypothetical protein BDZ90DRAFT_230874 [Jaminaea rosea]|uniref:Uncharacterized protein n=1 Tax=Jaminaea rosea TaxID=1569628 RepID=A0A316UU78_9BASI|nr:hypothetical protein BDZ90DRAFT_230874 [Jaminaea rosea]PWN28866.1 hypothetical protein BDZ90DRAFT_230874 [Jaminaea rosea]